MFTPKIQLYIFMLATIMVFCLFNCSNSFAQNSSNKNIAESSIVQQVATNITPEVAQDQSLRNRVGNSAKYGMSVAAKLLFFVLVCFACLVSLFLSSLSFSGSWLVLVVALISLLLLKTPGWGTLLVFFIASAAGEVIDAISSFHGVKKRGGSKLAGLAGFAGAIVGGIVGGAVIPVVGALVGLLAGTFLGVYLVELGRLKKHDDASHIAWGAFNSRIFVLFIKLVSTIVMSAWLLWCIGCKVF